jgi:hypothetical protein
MDCGTLVDHDGRPAVCFRREYPHPVERLWAAITEPGELAHWFPSNVRMEPKVGGTIEFFGDPNLPESGHAGTILVYDRPAGWPIRGAPVNCTSIWSPTARMPACSR